VAPVRAPCQLIASVVIAALNAQETIIESSMRSKLRTLPVGCIIVADNGSRDRSVELARSKEWSFAEYRVVAAREIRGCGHARNVAIREASLASSTPTSSVEC
jgi:glycosyltransferase involved in cell wall biosynthesis